MPEELVESNGRVSAEPIPHPSDPSWINNWSGVEGLSLTGGADWQQEHDEVRFPQLWSSFNDAESATTRACSPWRV